MNRPPRRLTLADLILLVVAAAVALSLVRFLNRTRPGGYQYDPGTGMALSSAPFPLAASAVLLIARAIPPRPRPGFRRVLRMPGTLACATITATVAFWLAIGTAQWLHASPLARRVVLLRNFLETALLTSFAGGLSVPFVWATLGITGRWQPEPDLVDRAGRAVGVAWVTVTLLNWWE